LHGWVYKIATGEVFAYDSDAGQFLPVEEDMRPARASASPGPIRAI
jgi:carbonic anhydrase